MAKCEDIGIVQVWGVILESKAYCEREKAIAEIVDKLLDKCAAERSKNDKDMPPCLSAKCDGGKLCLDYLTSDTIEAIKVTATRDPNCTGNVHYVATFNGAALRCGCHCDKLVEKQK